MMSGKTGINLPNNVFFRNLAWTLWVPIGFTTASIEVLEWFWYSWFHGVPPLDFKLKFMDNWLKKSKGGTPWNHEYQNHSRTSILTVVNPMGAHSVHAKFRKNILLGRLIPVLPGVIAVCGPNPFDTLSWKSGHFCTFDVCKVMPKALTSPMFLVALLASKNIIIL